LRGAGHETKRFVCGTQTAADLARTFLALDGDRNGVLDRYEYNSPAWRPFRDEPD
jgi:hypothetical protein